MKLKALSAITATGIFPAGPAAAPSQKQTPDSPSGRRARNDVQGRRRAPRRRCAVRSCASSDAAALGKGRCRSGRHSRCSGGPARPRGKRLPEREARTGKGGVCAIPGQLGVSALRLDTHAHFEEQAARGVPGRLGGLICAPPALPDSCARKPVRCGFQPWSQRGRTARRAWRSGPRSPWPPPPPGLRGCFSPADGLVCNCIDL